MIHLIVILLSLVAQNRVNCQTQDEIQNNPNNFHMFENFELTREVYIKEAILIPKIAAIQNLLEERKKNIQNYLDSRKSRTLSEFSLKLKEFRINNDIQKETIDLTEDFPQALDYEGSTGMYQKILFFILIVSTKNS